MRLIDIPRAWAGGLANVEFEAGTGALPGITTYNDADTGFYFSAANTIDASCGGIRSLQLATLASGVNYLKLSPATSAAALSAGVLLEAAGASTNVSIQLLPKGATGAVVMPAGLVATPGITFLADLNTGIWNSAADTLDVSCGAIRALQIATLASGVNYLKLSPATAAAALTAGVLLEAAGSSTHVSIQLLPKGANGQVLGPAGAVALPGIAFIGDIDTGLYQIGANNLGLATGGTVALDIGNAAAPASVGTTPGTAAATLLTMAGAVGGASSIATTGVGGVGGGFALTGGAGGLAAGATTASTGGVGGALALTGGAGGAANDAANVGTNIGGVGGAIALLAGTGGAAANGTDTGGVGGALTLYGGTGGSGDTGGVGGSVYVVGGAAGAGGAPATGDVHLGSIVAGTARGVIYVDTGMTFADAKDIAFNATTGTKIGTATTQKMGFWNHAPAVQPVTIADATGSGGGDAHTVLNTLLAALEGIGILAAA